MHLICRTCLCEINDDNRVVLSEDKESLRIKTELSVCVPEIVVGIVINPVVCFKCVHALHSAYEFKMQCLQAEERINNYVGNINLDTNCDVLVQMLKFSTCTASVNKTSINPCLKPTAHDIIDDLNNLLDEALQNAPKREIFADNNVECEDDFSNPQVIETYEIIDSDEDEKSTISQNNLTSKKCSVACAKLPGDEETNSKVEIMSITQKKPKLNGNRNVSFACHMCSYKGTKKQRLKAHITRIHGDKPFACQMCSYKGVTKKHLRGHIRRRHSDKRFDCNMCSYKCTYRYLLEKHIITHHRELKP